MANLDLSPGDLDAGSLPPDQVDVLTQILDEITDLSDRLRRLESFYGEIQRKLGLLSMNLISSRSDLSDLRSKVEDLVPLLEPLVENVGRLNEFFPQHADFFKNSHEMLPLLKSLLESLSRLHLEDALQRMEGLVSSGPGEVPLDQSTLLRSLHKLFVVSTKQQLSCKIIGFNFRITTLATINFFISLLCIIYLCVLSFSIGLQFSYLNRRLGGRRSSAGDSHYCILGGRHEASCPFGTNRFT